jgi:hypothetical protein
MIGKNIKTKKINLISISKKNNITSLLIKIEKNVLII